MTDAAGQGIQGLVDDLYERHRAISDGEVATYIPELGRADPADFGLCLTTADGRSYAAGDCDKPFTIQSISKPFLFGIAVDDVGRDRVLDRVDVEPSGEAFNSIDLQRTTNRPHNPMVNAGAIAVTALLHNRHGAHALDFVLDRLGAFAGRPLAIDEAVYESERKTGNRNRAIAYLLLNFGVLERDAEAALDLYFRQCSVLVTCRDLATMSATLANMGCHPTTGRSVLSMSGVKDVLSVMFTCGMYDYSGQWAFRVGVPAKSGVAGGVMAVVNRQLGVGTYSPRLDRFGNSVRGIEVCSELAARLGLHVFDCLNPGSTYLETVLSATPGS